MKTFGLNDDLPADLRRPTTRLTVDMIPSTSWWDNVRSRMPRADWDKLRKHCYRLANYRCEICGGSGFEQGSKWPVECHEVWNYDLSSKVQKLVSLIALCPKCHQVKHFGRTQLQGKEKEAIQHLMDVNHWNQAEAVQHIRQAIGNWKERSKIQWTLDIEVLKE